MKKQSFFVFGDDGLEKIKWIELKNISLKKNDYSKIEYIIEKYFKDYLYEKRKKRVYIKTLSYFFINIFRIIKSIEKDYDYNFILDENEFVSNKMKYSGFIIRFSYSKNYAYQDEYMTDKERSYHIYGTENIRHDFLIKVMKDLEKMNFCEHPEKGYSYQDNYKLGFEFINWKKIFQELYKPNRNEIIAILSNKKDTEENTNPIVIRQNKQDISNEKYKSLCRRSEIQDTKKYISCLTKMYNNMDIHIDYFQNGNMKQKQSIIEQWNKKTNRYFNIELYNHNVDVLNQFFKKEFHPYRLYHLHDKNLLWGRIYGGILDGYVDNFYKPLLKIDNQYAISIDIKSCLTQLFVINECRNIDNKQDFYYYDRLNDYLYRDDIKLITQCLNFCGDRTSAFRAYRSNSSKDRKKYSFINCSKDFYDVIDVMKQERSYLFQGLFLNELKCKRLIHIESEFMMKVSNLLFELGINHIYAFDALYVPISKLSLCLDTFTNVSLDMFNKSINVDYDIEMYQ